MTKRWAWMVLFLAICLLFLILNRGAYQGFFRDDELANISWTPFLPFTTYLKWLLSPQFSPSNFRPVGYAYFGLMDREFGLNFGAYVAVLQLLHLFTALALLRLARALKIPWHGAFFAAAFLALNVAIFDAVWKPMFVFDVLCGLWCVASILCYVERRYVLSFLCFWLAYKSKEVAVMLPLVLALHEYLLGRRRWWPLLPFAAASLSFGLQGLLLNPNRDNPYTFHFTAAALRATLPFYSSRLLMVPYGGLVFLVLPLFTRDRRVGWAAGACIILFLPLLFLPGRLVAAFCYVPLTAAALAVGAFASNFSAYWLLPLLALWLPWNIRELRIDRRATLADAEEARPFVLSLQRFAHTHPTPPPLIYENRPVHFAHFGVQAAVNVAYHRLGLDPLFFDSPQADALWGSPLAYLYWDAPRRQLFIYEQDQQNPLPEYLLMANSVSHSALLGGWMGLFGGSRWTGTHASLRLQQPDTRSRLELAIHIPEAQLGANRHAHVVVWLNGSEIGDADFTTPGAHTVSWNAPPGSGQARIDLAVDPPYNVPGETRAHFGQRGLAVVAIGFTAAPKNGAP